MDGPDTLSDSPEPAAQPAPPLQPVVPPPHHPWWLRELPYTLVLALTLFGVAYMSLSRQPMVGYWEFLAPVIGLVCIAAGWPHAHDRPARVRLIWTQVLHWLAFLVAMNLLLLGGPQSMLTADATGLTVLTLLALGTFVAGVHLQAWQICLLGAVMGASVPAIAWIERSSLFLLLAAVALLAIGLTFWWSMPRRKA
jgi:hypothetical protein